TNVSVTSPSWPLPLDTGRGTASAFPTARDSKTGRRARSSPRALFTRGAAGCNAPGTSSGANTGGGGLSHAVSVNSADSISAASCRPPPLRTSPLQPRHRDRRRPPWCSVRRPNWRILHRSRRYRNGSRYAGPAGDHRGPRQVDRGSPGLSLSWRLGLGLGLELGRGRSSDVWIGLWLERRGAGRTGQRDLPGCDAVEPPFVQC